MEDSNISSSTEDFDPDENNFTPSSGAFHTQEDFNENFSIDDPQIDEVRERMKISDLVEVPDAIEFKIPAVTYQNESAFLKLKLRNVKFPDISNQHIDFQDELTGDSETQYSQNLVQSYCEILRQAFLAKKILVLGPLDIQTVACVINGKHVQGGTTKIRQQNFLAEFLAEKTFGRDINMINAVIFSNFEMAQNSSLYLRLANVAHNGHFVAVNVDIEERKLKLFDTYLDMSFSSSRFFGRKMVKDVFNAIFKVFNTSRSHSLHDSYIITKTPQISQECGVYASLNCLLLCMFPSKVLTDLKIKSYNHYFIKQIKKLHALTLVLRNPCCDYINITNK